MSSLLHGNPNCSILRNNGATSFVGFSALPFMQLRAGAFMRGVLAGSFFSYYFEFCLVSVLLICDESYLDDIIPFKIL